MGIIVHRATHPSDCPMVDAALYGAFSSDQQIAAIIVQRLIGKKKIIDDNTPARKEEM